MNADSDRPFPAYSVTVRRVVVGGLTKAELLEQFQKHAISMNAQGEALFAALPETNAESSNIETVELTVQQLGFPEGATSVELFDQAVERGLALCPLEVAPYLRLQYLEQPAGFWTIIASPRPSAHPSLPTGFYLRRLEDGLWLRGYTAAPAHIWSADDHFVFCRSTGISPVRL